MLVSVGFRRWQPSTYLCLAESHSAPQSAALIAKHHRIQRTVEGQDGRAVPASHTIRALSPPQAHRLIQAATRQEIAVDAAPAVGQRRDPLGMTHQCITRTPFLLAEEQQRDESRPYRLIHQPATLRSTGAQHRPNGHSRRTAAGAHPSPRSNHCQARIAGFRRTRALRPHHSHQRPQRERRVRREHLQRSTQPHVRKVIRGTASRKPCTSAPSSNHRTSRSIAAVAPNHPQRPDIVC